MKAEGDGYALGAKNNDIIPFKIWLFDYSAVEKQERWQEEKSKKKKKKSSSSN
jgi:hypothetical protein